MSRIASVTPALATLQPGQGVDITVNVADVPADSVASAVFTASDGTTGHVDITIDRPALTALVGGTGTLSSNQIRGTVTGGGSLTVQSTSATAVVFRYTAP